MATIRKLPSGKWNVQVRRNGQLVASSTHQTREEAVAWGEQKEGSLKLAHLSFLDTGYAYCHEMLDRKPSQLRKHQRNPLLV